MNFYTSKETSQKLFELTGWKAHASIMVHKNDSEFDEIVNSNRTKDYSDDFISFPAYSTDFLLDKMPHTLEDHYNFQLTKGKDIYWAYYQQMTGKAFSFDLDWLGDKNPAEALGKTLIWLIENGYMEVKK